MAADLPLVPGREYRLDIWKIFVQRRAPDPRFLGDLRHGDSAQAVPSQKGRCRIQRRLAHGVPVCLYSFRPEFRHPVSIRCRLGDSVY